MGSDAVDGAPSRARSLSLSFLLLALLRENRVPVILVGLRHRLLPFATAVAFGRGGGLAAFGFGGFRLGAVSFGSVRDFVLRRRRFFFRRHRFGFRRGLGFLIVAGHIRSLSVRSLHVIS